MIKGRGGSAVKYGNEELGRDVVFDEEVNENKREVVNEPFLTARRGLN